MVSSIQNIKGLYSTQMIAHTDTVLRAHNIPKEAGSRNLT